MFFTAIRWIDMENRFKVAYYLGGGLERSVKYFDSFDEVKEFTKQFERNEDFIVYLKDSLGYYRLISSFWR